MVGGVQIVINMTIFFTSDNHISHRNLLLKYCPNRTALWKDEAEMNAALAYNWNETVGPSDTIYMLGDVFWGKDLDYHIGYLKDLYGKKHLILGNHDHMIENNKKRFLEEKVFETISHYKRIVEQNQKIVLFHYAMRTWDQSFRGSYMLFGHTHNSLPPYGKSVDVGIDSSWVTGRFEHRPFSFDEIKAFMDKQTQIETYGD